MKYGILGSLALLVSACDTPQEILAQAQSECSFIGYDIDKERVPTLQCTERGYRSRSANQGATATNVGVGVATVVIAKELVN